MAQRSQVNLSRRERQIMDIVYKLGQATAADVQASLPDPPGYSAVRALLRILEEGTSETSAGRLALRLHANGGARPCEALGAEERSANFL